MKMHSHKFLVGSAILIVAGALVGKANTKYGNVSSLYYTKSGLCKHLIGPCTSSNVLTTGGFGMQMKVTSVGGTAYNVFSTSACTPSHKVHFHS